MVCVIGIMNSLCFIIGARVGQKVVKQEEIKIPTINPVKVVQDISESRELNREAERNRIIAENIDNYNGTEIGQQNIPR